MNGIETGVYADIHGKYGFYGGLFFVELDSTKSYAICYRMNRVEPKIIKIPLDLFLSLDCCPQGLMKLVFECGVGSINRLLPGSCVNYLGHSYRVFGSEYVGWQAYIKLESIDSGQELISTVNMISRAEIINTD